ncbi:hypothetical protein SAMN04487951_1351, partial [Vreelandella arcis]
RLNESTGAQVRVRIDAGFTDNSTLEALEERDIEYLGRLRSHSGLQTLAAPYLKRPRGRPPEQPREWCHDLTYQAGPWPAPRRVVLVVQERPDDLLLHAFFLVTNLGQFVSAPITTSSQSLFRRVTSLSTAKVAACSVRHRC